MPRTSSAMTGDRQARHGSLGPPVTAPTEVPEPLPRQSLPVTSPIGIMGPSLRGAARDHRSATWPPPGAMAWLRWGP
jgi:hypothetical protein